ncbi:MAG: hypothetical protein JWN61_1969 [Pseudonocardiales bacterium]|nr:hypothetical protein [Pseudonocardiales bacterium]
MDRSSAVRRVLLLVFVYFMSDAMFQTLLPVSMDANGITSGFVIGIFIAAASGVGILLAPPATAWGDRHGRARVLVLGGLASFVAMLLMAGAARGGSAWLWLFPVLLYGVARATTAISTLAVVSTTGDPLRMQGLNSVAQRGSAAIGAIATAGFIATGHYSVGFALMSLTGLYVCLVARRVAPPPAPENRATVAPRDSYAVSLRMLRDERALQASSLINIGAVTIGLLGNAFYPLALDVRPDRLAFWVLVLLLFRDITSVCVGPFFHVIVTAVGVQRVMVILASSNVASLVIVALAGSSVPWICLAAVLQGAAMSLSIGSTNFMATQGGRLGGRGLRITATNYGISVSSLFLPLMFGALFDILGSRAVFITGAVVVAAVMGGAVHLARGWSPVGARVQAPRHGDDEGPYVGADLHAEDAGDVADLAPEPR